MKLIAGLGNPGPRYADSRHNIGFRVVAELARRWVAPEWRFERRCEGLLTDVQRHGDRIWLLQPQTYMNLSGRSVAALLRYYKVPLADLLVIYDDLDLPVGHLRLRAGGSAGGHNGVTDVIRQVGSEAFARVRIGIGKVDRGAMVDYVLSKFAPDERDAIDEGVSRAADAAECWLAQGITTAMNEFNRKQEGRSSD